MARHTLEDAFDAGFQCKSRRSSPDDSYRKNEASHGQVCPVDR